MQVEGHISIEIDPEDMDRVSDFFESIIFNRQQLSQPRLHSRCGIIRLTKKVLSAFIQMFGIMTTLVCANLVTTRLSQTSYINPHQVEEFDRNLTSITKVETCNNNFGCNQSLCWRSCTVHRENDLVPDYTSWCFTSPDKNGIVHQCESHLDCSGCWECSHPCTRKVG